MTRPEAIRIAKQFRQDAGALLQRMKASAAHTDHGVDAFRHHMLSIQGLEDCILRQGMVLKSIGNENPYPNSYNPGSVCF